MAARKIKRDRMIVLLEAQCLQAAICMATDVLGGSSANEQHARSVLTMLPDMVMARLEELERAVDRGGAS